MAFTVDATGLQSMETLYHGEGIPVETLSTWAWHSFPNTGNLTLDGFDVALAPQDADKTERMIRKLRAGMMPPRGMPRPDPAARDGLIMWLETELDRAAETHLPPPGLHQDHSLL